MRTGARTTWIRARRWIAPIACGFAAVAILAAPVAAYPVNFGPAYVPDPAHGYVVSIPQWATDRSSFGSWSLLAFGLTERAALGVDLFYLTLPGGQRDLGNLTLTLYHALDDPLAGMNARAGALAGLSVGAYGAPLVGGFANAEWSPLPRLRHYSAVAAYLDGGRGYPRVALDTGLEARVTPWLGLILEVLTGFPSWEYGPNARLGLAPGATLYLTDALAILLTYRMPLWTAEGARVAGPPAVGVGLTYGW